MTAKLPNLESVTYPFAGSVAVEIGDLMFRDGSGYAYPASSLANTGTEPTDAVIFAAAFAGVSKERKLAADGAGDIDVVPDWVDDFACESQTWLVGDRVKVYELGAELADQKVAKTTTTNEVIGYCVQAEPVATTKVRVRLQSAITPN